jgi:hypothetical protein
VAGGRGLAGPDPESAGPDGAGPDGAGPDGAGSDGAGLAVLMLLSITLCDASGEV